MRSLVKLVGGGPSVSETRLTERLNLDRQRIHGGVRRLETGRELVEGKNGAKR